MANRAIRRAAGSKNPRASTVLVQKLVIKAALEHSLIENGDRILIAASGGKDSTVMAMTLAAARPALKPEYSLAAVHISTDFCACCKKSTLAASLESWGIPFADIFVPVIGRLKEGRKMNCYWCSTQRRIELLRYAMENGYNTIALGHHLDDIIETFFMNMCGAGALKTMPALLRYRKYPVKLIRPLVYVEEKQIIASAAENGILKAACTCPYGRLSARRVMREKIAAFTGGSSAVKRRILAAIGNSELSI
ncbi:MAG: tRNA 2-thiocytidine biosynthesis TtcA family protein [Spirochaetaceae bacterium]|nr:tRNA 2-thiocytidine biosynthesis TtcA family protein [Spirochaetaceae bacterium]